MTFPRRQCPQPSRPLLGPARGRRGDVWHCAFCHLSDARTHTSHLGELSRGFSKSLNAQETLNRVLSNLTVSHRCWLGHVLWHEREKRRITGFWRRTRRL